jgi:2-oxoglutarate dehydrogenase E1 component
MAIVAWGIMKATNPAFTQPVLYKAIAKRPSVREGYLEHLLRLQGVTREEADAIAAKRRELLEKELSNPSPVKCRPPRNSLTGYGVIIRVGPSPWMKNRPESDYESIKWLVASSNAGS